MYTGNENSIVTAKCPYFRCEFVKTISCEGIGNAVTTTLKFKDEEDKDIHICAFCKKYPNTCEIAKVLDEQWQQ